jgi:hypothetical protein
MTRTFCFGLIFAAAAMVAAPASGQILVYTGPGGSPVAIGPSYFSYYDNDWPPASRVSAPSPAHAQAVECRAVRERVQTPGGRTIVRVRRDC